MTLEQEIEKKAKEIQTDSYPMSIGELTSMYKEEELDLNPDFQRFFRWNINQKSKFIESILLGIPIPSIFIAQDAEGRWDVIDGLQRLSTIFELMGILKTTNEDGEQVIKPPLKLVGTDFLPSLNDKVWENNDDPLNSLDHGQRFKVKRAKLTIQIIKETSDPEAKYELFQRLNTGGSNLGPQEIRNCILLMVKKEFFKWIEELSNNTAFLNTISISEKQTVEQYEKELIVRYLVTKFGEIDKIKGNEDIHDYLTEEIIKVTKLEIDYQKEKEQFYEIFNLLNRVLGEDSFRKYNEDKNRFMGAFSLATYEAIISGLIYNLDTIKEDDLKSLIEKIHLESEFKNALGQRPIQRFKTLVSFGKEYFSE
ncbi:DUF262 domain-containing protein [Peribacillus butanolivorans]|uniref:DUF262 domain-containing protein n=1 Tax=Peribacillus butanolivorans TaxID=421767 RepID=UPI00364C27CB